MNKYATFTPISPNLGPEHQCYLNRCRVKNSTVYQKWNLQNSATDDGGFNLNSKVGLAKDQSVWHACRCRWRKLLYTFVD